MSDEKWNPWKMTTVGLGLVIVTALITGLVVASWNGSDDKPATPAPVASAPAPKPAPRRVIVTQAPPAPAPVAPAPVAPAPVAQATPSADAVQVCNAQANEQVGNKTIEVVKDAAIGGALGAGVGAAGGAIAGGGKSAGKGAGIGGVVGLAAGTLYGLNGAKSHDERYVEAYRSCMKARGYTG